MNEKDLVIITPEFYLGLKDSEQAYMYYDSYPGFIISTKQSPTDEEKLRRENAIKLYNETLNGHTDISKELFSVMYFPHAKKVINAVENKIKTNSQELVTLSCLKIIRLL